MEFARRKEELICKLDDALAKYKKALGEYREEWELLHWIKCECNKQEEIESSAFENVAELKKNARDLQEEYARKFHNIQSPTHLTPKNNSLSAKD